MKKKWFLFATCSMLLLLYLIGKEDTSENSITKDETNTTDKIVSLKKPSMHTTTFPSMSPQEKYAEEHENIKEMGEESLTKIEYIEENNLSKEPIVVPLGEEMNEEEREAENRSTESLTTEPNLKESIEEVVDEDIKMEQQLKLEEEIAEQEALIEESIDELEIPLEQPITKSN